MVFSVPFALSPSEIVKVLKDLSAYINRDKNAICLALIIVDETIGRWYRDLSSFAVDQMAKHLLQQGQPITQEDARAAFSLKFGSNIDDTVNESLNFLKDVKKRYDSGELGRLVGSMDIVEIMKINDLIEGSSNGGVSQDIMMMKVPVEQAQLIRIGFRDLARNDTYIYNLSEITKGFGGPERAQTLQNWLRSLEEIKILINKIVTEQLSSLGCQQQMILQLRQRVFPN